MTGATTSNVSGRLAGGAFEDLRVPLTCYFRRRVRQQDDVGDLVQEVFVRLFNREGANQITNLRGYSFQIAASVLTDSQRHRKVRRQSDHVEFDPEHMGPAEIAPDRILIGRETLSVAVATLHRLPERTRTIFILRRLEGMRYLEISRRLGISVSAVEKHMARAVAHLASAAECR